MGQVNRVPSGFLDLVGSQSQGQTPPLYSDALSPVVDLRELYLAQTLSQQCETKAHVAFGATQDFTVPAGETWLVRSVSWYAVLPLTGTERWAWSILRPARGTTGAAVIQETYLYASALKSVAINNQMMADAYYFPHPIALLNGTILRATILERDAGAVRNTNVSVLMNRLLN
jgi:hypothetical protein